MLDGFQLKEVTVINKELLARMVIAVDTALRVQFPTSFHQRCLYSTAGLLDLLNSLGFEANAVAGRYAILAIDKLANTPRLIGFNGTSSSPSHYWVEIESKIIDLSPHYLAKCSNSNLAALPALFLAKRTELPYFIRYEAQSIGSKIRVSDEKIIPLFQNFLKLCRIFFEKPIGPLLPNFWFFNSNKQIIEKSKTQDTWATYAATLLRSSSTSLEEEITKNISIPFRNAFSNL